VVVAAFLAIFLAIAALVRRGRRHRVVPAVAAAAVAPAVGAAPAVALDPAEAPTTRSVVEANDPYATLGAPPGPGVPDDLGDAGGTGARPD
jgi:hypothetical protein